MSGEDEAMNSARGFLYAEYFPAPTLALRFGIAADSASEVTYNFGLGYYGFDTAHLHFGYSHNAFPEVAHEFGTTHYLRLIVSTSFYANQATWMNL